LDEELEKKNELGRDSHLGSRMGEMKKIKKKSSPSPTREPKRDSRIDEILVRVLVWEWGGKKEEIFVHPPPPYENPNEILMYDYAIADRS
jgi:hypothetical protein